ncbi:MAG TPA: cobalamin-independent methionine synthase II family protein [Dehalococcoidia bacterium]|nr:cobalamin-independent methionine synthase II family protein [Dehalococcoidia bacterium]
MKRSTDRILMSHAGSLHRPDDLRETMASRRDDEPIDDALAARIKDAVKEVVKLQAENGVDVVNDGEYTKRSWQTYSRGRLSGLEQRPLREGEDPNYGSITARESKYFPDFFARGLAPFGAGRPASANAAGGGFAQQAVFCVGPLQYIGQKEVQRDIDYIKEAAKGVNVEELCLTALAPATIEHWMRNQHYNTQEDMLFAIADAMHEEYKAITDAGITLQIDDPDLPDGYHVYPEMSIAEYRKFAEVRVEAINRSLRGIPEELVRLHICWGSIHHPHTQDIPLKDIIDLVFAVKAQCYSIEAANPQHEHEWNVFENVKLPDGKILMPGVLGHCAPEFVEHPELVAQRLLRYANLVGRENVIGGTDCGLQRVRTASIQWAKFRAGAEGARIATKKLWGRN